MNALEFLKTKGVFYGVDGFAAYGEFGEIRVAEILNKYAQLKSEPIKKECKRLKLQRNEYDDALRKAINEIIKLRAELKMK